MSIKYVDLNADLGEEVTDDVAPGLLGDQVADQIGVLSEIAVAAGTSVRYLKPHGALYHRVMIDEEQAAAVLAASGTLPVLGMPGVFVSLADPARRAVFHEGFPGSGLWPRRETPAALGSGCGAVRRRCHRCAWCRARSIGGPSHRFHLPAR